MSAVAALLATEQHQPMFQHVQHLALWVNFSSNLLQVSGEGPVESGSVRQSEHTP
jgi:hypothetical protein